MRTCGGVGECHLWTYSRESPQAEGSLFNVPLHRVVPTATQQLKHLTALSLLVYCSPPVRAQIPDSRDHVH